MFLTSAGMATLLQAEALKQRALTDAEGLAGRRAEARALLLRPSLVAILGSVFVELGGQLGCSGGQEGPIGAAFDVIAISF